ncbi:DUF6624 domain-containing protein [Maricaulis sp. D1M11]|uniref:DUF6624 domain-containing protein n=1 Tax=Maricaulis sp. D1M11 TaxID=3076117 RepID=UPI0039B6CEC5
MSRVLSMSVLRGAALIMFAVIAAAAATSAQLDPAAQRVEDGYAQLETVAMRVSAIEARRDMLEDLETEVSSTEQFNAWRAALRARDDVEYAALVERSRLPARLEEYPGAGGVAAAILDATGDPDLKVILLTGLERLAERGRFPRPYYESLARRHVASESDLDRETREIAESEELEVPGEIADIYLVYAPIAQEMGARRGQDQLIRWLLVDTMANEVDDESRARFLEGVNPIVGRIDDANTRYVIEVFEELGFDQIFEHVPSIAELGIAIIHHGNNLPARRSFLTIIEPLALRGEFDQQRYAVFYDRLAETEGRPQRYGTQDMCVDGERVPYTLEEPAGEVDIRRSEVGLGSIDDYFELIRGQYGGC